jgi:hypothetical protein
MKQTYTGGCHCGAVRYEADMDLSQGTLKCNCSICRKTRAWLVGIGADDFRLLKGQEALSDYQFGSKNIHHLFCKHCGVKSFGRAAAGPGGKPFVAVLLSTVDDISDADLAATPVIFIDGRNNNFAAAPDETRYL